MDNQKDKLTDGCNNQLSPVFVPGTHRPPSTSNSSNRGGDATSCGCRSWRPRWLRPFSGVKTFTFLLSLVAMSHHIQIFYYNGVVTSIEKVFGLSSSTTGTLKNINNLSYIACAVLISHFLRYSNKPRIMAASTLLSAVASLLFALPHLIYGKGMMSDSPEHRAAADAGEVDAPPDVRLCVLDDYTNSTSAHDQRCSSAGDSDGGAAAVVTVTGGLVLMVVAQIIRGAAQSPIMALGFTYIDDNAKEKSPIYIGCMFLTMAFGHFGGMLLSGLANGLYVDLSEPNIDRRDPSWVGAWWLGYVLLVPLYILLAIPILLFPDKIRPPKARTRHESKSAESAKSKKRSHDLASYQGKGLADVMDEVKDLPAAIWRLLTNPFYMFIIISVTIEMYKTGYITFLPKYFELYFHLEPVKASLFAGSSAAVPFVLGPMLGGVAMSRYKISVSRLTKIILAIQLVSMVMYACLLLVQCPQVEWNLNTSACSASCGCQSIEFQPVCGSDGRSYWGACQAGCLTNNSSTMSYTDCMCIEHPTSNTTGSVAATAGVQQVVQGGTATSGGCGQACSLVPVFMSIYLAGALAATITFVPVFSTMMRCVDDRDKALCTAAGSTVILGLNVPAPILFGFVIDSACIAYRTLTCGSDLEGSCAVYDPDSLRFSLNGLLLGTKVLATVCFVGAVVSSQKKRYAHIWVKDTHSSSDSSGATEGEGELKQEKEVEMKMLPNDGRDV